MKLTKKCLVTISILINTLCLLTFSVQASPNLPIEGTDYLKLSPPKSTESLEGLHHQDYVKNRVNVIEFFGYFCPHCYELEPTLQAWAKKEAKRINLIRIPVEFGSSKEYLAQKKIYYTLVAMKKIDTLHRAIFDAIHKKKVRLGNDKQIKDFIEKSQWVDPQKFNKAYNDEFNVDTNVKKAKIIEAQYAIERVPVLFVEGKYLTSPDLTRSIEGTAAVLSFLVDKVEKEKAAALSKK